MKRVIAFVLTFCMLCALSGCGSSDGSTSSAITSSTPNTSSATSTSSVSSEHLSDTEVYPIVAEVIYFGKIILPPPEIIYSTYAEENGLDGNVYAVTGTVTEIEEDQDGEQYSWIFLDTEYGPVVFGNPVNSLLKELDESADAERMSTFFSEPDVGDYVCIYGEYIGYSDRFNCASFAYGGSEYMIYAYVDCVTSPSDEYTYNQDNPSISDNEPYEEDEPEESATTITISQQNALDSAKSYLAYTAFSYEGLIDQLEYEQFSTEDATYAADNCGADWNEQALLSAQSYLEYTAFSYSGLIDQLEFEEFTTEQATYAADNCDADWNEQAAKSAESYLNYSSFSRDGLIDQLEFEGFTHEQAVYGVEANGF